MTERLEQAIAQLGTLSTDQQDAIANLILAELEEEQRWDDSFARSRNLLAKLAAEAMAEHRSGKTQELDQETL
jgi:aspartate/glutamate racemase